ncbi:MAG: hypothetical protein IJE87_08390, partial [Firmicutes bacterium]|nr:hypothetical protein [Bacillota bacterium]
MLTAPILHARTQNNDFPSSMLVVPQGFTAEDTSWARKYIKQSTRYLELAKNHGRRLIFCNETLLVTGLTIRIRDLYAICGKAPKYDTVETHRTNFAFIGLVIPKSEITAPFDVPYSIFLEQYEAYMDLLWNIPFSDAGLTAVSAPYRNIAFPAAREVFDLPDPDSDQVRYVLDANIASLESLAAKSVELMMKRNNFAFCSDIPSVNNVIDGDFRIVTSYQAQKIIDDLTPKEPKGKGENGKRKFPFWPKTEKEKSGVFPDNAVSLWEKIPQP